MTEIEEEQYTGDSSVAVLKLVTNETIVSEVVEENDEFIVLRRPLVINSMFDKDGEPKIAYRVWMPYNSDDITVVNKTAMVALCIASPYYSKNYLIGVKEMLRYRKEAEADEVEDVKQDMKKDIQKEDNVIFLNTDKNTVH
jgi:hypothetical protein